MQREAAKTSWKRRCCVLPHSRSDDDSPYCSFEIKKRQAPDRLAPLCSSLLYIAQSNLTVHIAYARVLRAHCRVLLMICVAAQAFLLSRPGNRTVLATCIPPARIRVPLPRPYPLQYHVVLFQSAPHCERRETGDGTVRNAIAAAPHSTQQTACDQFRQTEVV